MTSMRDAIAENLGYLGVSSAVRGGVVIQAKAPPSLPEVSGFGDTFRVGDVVTFTNFGFTPTPYEDTYPVRIEAIFDSRGEGLGPSLLSRKIDAPAHHGPTSFLASGGGWTRRFKKLTQADVDAWFAKAKALLPDGWHKVHDGYGSVLVENGVPTKVKRASTFTLIERVAVEAGVMTGYLLGISGRYEDSEKTIRKVKTAWRLPPPKV